MIGCIFIAYFIHNFTWLCTQRWQFLKDYGFSRVNLQFQFFVGVVLDGETHVNGQFIQDN